MQAPPIPGWPVERLEVRATLVVGRSGSIVYASQAYLDLTGLPRDRVVGARERTDPAMARGLEDAREFLLSGAMARLGIRSGQIEVPARPGPTLRCRFVYDPIPERDPEYHVFVYEREGAESPERRALRLEKALYEIQLVLDRVVPGMRRELAQPVELASLTNRELDVLKLLLEGASNEQVAKQLHVSPHTAKSHTKAIFRKLDVTSRAELLARFVRTG